MSTMVSSSQARQLDHQPALHRVSVRTGIIIGATVIAFAVLHVTGMALIMSASDQSTAESAVALRGD